jgi:hypothetical protein
MRILACALLLATPVARAQSREPFRFPQIRTPAEEPPEGCDRARRRAAEILAEIEKEIPAAMQAFVREVAADLEPGDTPAEGWDQAAALAALNADPPTALWAELQALAQQWDDVFATNAGIYLYYLDKHDDATLFLHCAYDMGGRSPFLLEALGNVHRTRGDKQKALLFISEAEAAAPADALIKIGNALAETGRPPPPPPPLANDLLGRAFAELQLHQQNVLAAIIQAYALQDRIDDDSRVLEEAALEAALKKQFRRDMLEIIRTAFQAANDTLKATMSQLTALTGNERRSVRTGALYHLAGSYQDATNYLLRETWSARMIWGCATLDLSFWGEALGFGPAQLNRMFLALRNFEQNGIRADWIGGLRAGGEFDEFGAAPFSACSRRAELDRNDGLDACRGIRSPEAHEACKLEVDKKYCAAMRELFREYVSVSGGWFQKAAVRFDAVAARRLAWGAVQVEDAFVYASTCAKEYSFGPAQTAASKLLVEATQRRHQDLVALVLGGEESDVQGPAAQVRTQAETYRMQKERAEREHEDLGSAIERECAPVDRKVLEQLIEEQRLAIQSMLLDRLKRDFDAEWDPTVSCSFSGGKFFQAGIDDTGKVSLGGKWKWLDKKFPSADHVPDQVELARNYKFNFKDGRFVGVSAGVEGSAKYGPFTGKGSATMGVAWNSKTSDWDFPVEFGGTLGIGFKTKGGYGATCYPGKARLKFEARAVAKDAWVYARSLDPE